jgi:hypothetical protein
MFQGTDPVRGSTSSMKEGSMKTGALSVVLMIVSAAVLVMPGCGGEETAPVEPAAGDAAETLHVAVTDTIGIDMGDSLYVFGSLMQAGFLPDGSVLALDLQRGYVNVYSPDGVHTGTVGAHGPGPGEFEIPTAFAVFYDGGVAVTDIVGRDISFFDSSLSYTGVLGGFQMGPPMGIAGCPDGSLVGQSMTMVFTDEGVEGSQDLSRWENLDDTEASQVYMTLPVEMNVTGDQGAEVRTGPMVDYSVGPDGSLAVVETSDTLFSLRLLSPDGEELMAISEERDRVPLTQEELDAGALGLQVMITDGSASASTSRIEDIYPYRNIIQSVGIDADRRIWVELGYGEEPFFQVFDYSGEMLFTAFVDAGFDNITRPSFEITPWGMLAFDQDPMDYPKIYLLELEP